ncbi:MAG: DUF4082 domain-containing protein [Anaerolineales bacterium]|nr:DUF4082 domain-containing protein [Anaerolineales bacterium]
MSFMGKFFAGIHFLIALTVGLTLPLAQAAPVRADELAAPAADTTGLPALPRTLWSDTAEPANPNFQDVGGPIQLGVRFTSTDSGYVTGIRFFKGSQNTGTHTGQLYDLAGNLLASAVFTNETAAGWQTVYFAAPVFITAGQTYVASYHTASGFYARTPNYFTSARVNLPLTAPADDGGVTNINGVYAYSTTPTYPDQAYEQSNYWVDVVFETPEMPARGTLGVYVGARVTYRFPTAMNPATINAATFLVRNPANEILPATVSYDSAARMAILTPASQFNNQTTYSVTILGGAGGVRDALGNPLPADITWNFTTEAAYPDSGPGGPILVIGSTYDGFSRYYPEILRAEGLNAFRFTDLSRVSAATLNNYDVVILAHTTLSDTQAAMFTNWVTNGGNLIAMRPDPRLASLLGIAPAGSPPLSEGYILVNGSGPGAGIVNQTIQYHGAADRYLLSGAANLATLYADAFTATASPAVTLASVGANGGQAAMFAYDLARSVVLTRQGNPRWSGDDRDGIIPTRSADLFYGNKAGDPQPDWVNLDKVAIPQADEQQRLLANLILSMNLDKKPLPRFWYFPRDEKAVVVMTSDDHADNVVYNSLYDDRLDQLNAYSPPGCSVDDWECVRQSIYLVVGFVTNPAENAKIQAYAAQGHEFGVHISTNCADYTNAALDAFFTSGMAWFGSNFSFLPAPRTERTHCVAWSNYVEHIKVRRSHGIRLDTNFYYYPASWVNNRPGMFTGSGLMMKFADLDGSLIDVYQAVTHMTDEAGQTYPYTIDTLLDNALGPLGYYGAFVTNIHSDSGAFSDANIDIIESSLARGVPIISAQQMLTWLDGRNGSSFSAFDWQNDILSFRVNAAAGARGLRGMLPVQGPNHPLTAITRNGVQIAYRTEFIKGVEYAFFDAPSGDYQAFYAPDTTPPVITNVQATINGDGTVTITWDTDEFANSRVDYGTNPLALTNNAQDSALTLAHSITLTGLTPNTTYHYRVTSADAWGNSATEPPEPNLPLSFTTPYNPFTDTTVIDFQSGTLAACYVGAADNGELLLGPTLGEEFSGTGLPAGWTPYAWAGHAPVVATGRLTLDDAAVYYASTAFGPGHSLEFTATFGADDYQLAGFVGNGAWNEYWAAFGTVASTNQVYITISGGTNIPIGALVGAPHRYRIQRVGNVFTFYVDDVQVGSPAGYTPPGVGNVRIGFIDDEYDGDPLRVDWLRVAPYATPCVFTSRVFDAGLPSDWLLLTWLGTAPAGTTAAFETRTGNTPTPDASWSAWEAVSGTDMVSPDGRYAQYRATLTTSSPFFITPIVESVSLTYAAINQPPTVSIDQFITQTDPTNASPIRFTVVFSEPVSGFDGSDVLLSGTAGATTVVVTGSGATYIVEVSGMGADGTVIATIPANAALDSGGLGNLASTSTDNTVTYDTTAPTVTVEQAAGQSDPTNATPILFTVTFSEPVSGFTASDVVLSGTAGATTVNVTGLGPVYTLEVSGMATDGTVIAAIPANAAQDAAGNGNAASTSVDNQVTFDALGPTVTVEQAAAQPDPTNAGPILFTVTFSEPVSGFTASDVVLSGTAGATTVVVTGSEADYTLSVSGMAVDGTVSASIPFGAAQDGSGNDSLASTSADNTVTYDTTPPVVTIGAPGLAVTNSGPVTFPVTVSGASTVNLTAGDVTLNATGTANGAITVTNGATATPTITVSGISGNGTLGISIAAGIALDAAGNSSAAAGPSSTFVVDNTAPTVVSITRADPSPTNAASVNFNVTFSEPVGGLAAANFSLPALGVTGASITAISGGGANYTVTVNTGAGDGVLGLNLVNSTGLADPAGNAVSGLPFAGEMYVIEKLNPQVVSITRVDPNPTTATSVRFAITFSKAVTGVSDSSFSLAATGVSGASLVSVTGSGASYTAVVNVGTGEGTLGLNLTDASGISDAVGNPLTGVPFTGEFYTIDLTPPTLTANGVSSVPATGDGAITELEIVTVNITQLLVRFSEDVNDPPGDSGANDVTNPANYLLVQDNGDGIQTDSCAVGVNGGDLPALIDAVTYDNTTFTATLNLNGGGGLANGVYRLLVCGTTSITDLAGNRLAGDGTNAQTDFSRNFIMAARGVGGGEETPTPIRLNDVLIPATGFEPGILTDLPAQPASKMYTAYSGLILEIPRLGVKVEIVGVPFTEQGWDVTWLYKQAGYLHGSAFPTTAGNSVITAHVWDALNRPGPFYGLKDLVYGDKIIVRAWGKVFTYEVQSNARISPRSIYQVMKRETLSWLTLVTCETFDADKGNYLYRRMVRAVLVSVSEEK